MVKKHESHVLSEAPGLRKEHAQRWFVEFRTCWIPGRAALEDKRPGMENGRSQGSGELEGPSETNLRKMKGKTKRTTRQRELPGCAISCAPYSMSLLFFLSSLVDSDVTPPQAGRTLNALRQMPLDIYGTIRV